MNSNDPSSPTAGWDTYWHGTGGADAYSAGGARHPALQAFWSDFFERWGSRYPAAKYVDVATGSGAVLESALQIFDENNAKITCVDIAPAAIDNVVERFAGVNGVVADAAAMPLEDAAYDVVTSQFGVEYAGAEAIFEAARLVAPGGCMGILMHIENGVVHKECADSLAAIERLRATEFIRLATELFHHGFAAVRGADRAPYDNAGKELAPAVAELEKTLDEFGDDVAGGALSTLYDDVARIHSRMPNYEPDDVLGWLRTMDVEIDAYAERMASMLSTATSTSDFEAICARLENGGFSIAEGRQLEVDDNDLPLAWMLVATRKADAADDATRAWTQELIDKAVRGAGDSGITADALIEARPAWALPNRLLVGQVRDQTNPRSFHWFICGEVPLDFLPHTNAPSPRDALRHFAMKWQLDAERTSDAARKDELVDLAESVYELADDERLWQ